MKPCPATHTIETGQRYRCTQERGHATDHGTSCMSWPLTDEERSRPSVPTPTARASRNAASAPPAVAPAPSGHTESAQLTLLGDVNERG